MLHLALLEQKDYIEIIAKRGSGQSSLLDAQLLFALPSTALWPKGPIDAPVPAPNPANPAAGLPAGDSQHSSPAVVGPTV